MLLILIITQQDIPAGSPVMYVPADLTFTSSKAEQEFGGALSQCEMQLIQAGLQDKVPLFRVFFKVVSEYIKGEEVCVCLFYMFACCNTSASNNILFSLHGTPG